MNRIYTKFILVYGHITLVRNSSSKYIVRKDSTCLKKNLFPVFVLVSPHGDRYGGFLPDIILLTLCDYQEHRGCWYRVEIERNRVSKHQIQSEYGEWAGWRGTGRLNPSRETKFSGAYGDRGILIFLVQLITSRIGNLTRLILTLAICDDHVVVVVVVVFTFKTVLTSI